jgi:hypothetical protein
MVVPDGFARHRAYGGVEAHRRVEAYCGTGDGLGLGAEEGSAYLECIVQVSNFL